LTRAHGAKSAPLGYHGFPKSICTSINEVICHGIPSADQILKDGDIINIDVTPILEGYHGDTSQTFFVGTPSPLAKKLVEVTRECLQRGIDAVQPGGKIGDIGAAIQEYAEGQGFSVVRDFVGHGISNVFHTGPQVPHYGIRGKGKTIRPGMVFTIEPMINEGTWQHIVLKTVGLLLLKMVNFRPNLNTPSPSPKPVSKFSLYPIKFREQGKGIGNGRMGK